MAVEFEADDLPGDLAALRRLWRAVLGEQLKLALGGANRLAYHASGRVARAEAVTWIGTRDFEIVCTLAGYDPAFVSECYRARQNDPEFDMRAYWRADRAGAPRKAAA